MPNSPRGAPQGARIPHRILLGGSKIPRGFGSGVPKTGEAKFPMSPGRIRYASDFDPTSPDSIRGINSVMGLPLSTSQSELRCINADLTYRYYVDYESTIPLFRVSHA